MPEWEKIVLWLIPVYMIAYAAVFGIFLQWISRRFAAKKCADCQNWIEKQMGDVVCVCGPRGAGKTTGTAGLCNMMSIILRKLAVQTCSDVVLSLPFLDFNKIDGLISVAFYNRLSNADAIVDFVYGRYPEIARRCEGRFYDDYLFPQSMASLLKDYINARIALIRNNFVYFSMRQFYCWSDDEWAMDGDSAKLDMKDVHLHKDYCLQRYSCFFLDEGVVDGHDSMHAKGVAKDDSGRSLTLRLFRHIGKGTMRLIVTTQDFGRIVKEERELYNGVLEITGRFEQTLFSFRRVWVGFLFDFLSVWYSMINGFKMMKADSDVRNVEKLSKGSDDKTMASVQEKVRKLMQDPSLFPGKQRDVLYKLSQSMKADFADGFLLYTANYWPDFRSYDAKEPPQMIQLWFPLAWCYGSVDTYSFSIYGDYLSHESISKADWYDPRIHSVPDRPDAELRFFFDRMTAKRNGRDVSADVEDPIEF